MCSGSSPSTVTEPTTVRNIEANPHVRVNAGEGWRTGIARIVDEDPHTRLERMVDLNPRAGASARIVESAPPSKPKRRPHEVSPALG
jgi:F420H(2)-dependent quinone reductase